MRRILNILYKKADPIIQEGLNVLSCLRHKKMREARHCFIWLLERLKLRFKNSRKVLCECCGWQGNMFFPYLNIESGYYSIPYELCPECYSKSRFRLLVRYIKSHSDFLLKKKNKNKLLEVGPVKSFQDWLLAFASYNNIEYISIGLENRVGVREVMDLRRLRFPDKSFDIIICSHVLEHIKEDTIALGELRRVLRNDGIAFIQVPIDMMLDETIEYNEPNPKEFGHIRRYGKDFVNRLKKAGFILNTDAITFASNLSINECNQYGIKKEESLFLISKG